jgi:hypothetical protein
MGAGASVKMLYKEAFGWFKQYMDTEVFIYTWMYKSQIHVDNVKSSILITICMNI